MCFKEIFLSNCHKNGQECSANDFVKILEKHSIDRNGFKQICSEKFTGSSK